MTTIGNDLDNLPSDSTDVVIDSTVVPHDPVCRPAREIPIPSIDLALYLPLDQDTFDYSGNCRNASLDSAAVFIESPFGGSLLFDGHDGLLKIAAQASPWPSTEFTLVMLARPTGTGKIISIEDYWVAYRESCSSGGCGLGFGDASGGSGYTNLQLPSWFVVTLRFDPARSSRFDDSSWSLQTDPSLANWTERWDLIAGVSTGGSPIYLGGNPPGSSQSAVGYKGVIDEVMIFTRALQASELRQLTEYYYTLVN